MEMWLFHFCKWQTLIARHYSCPHTQSHSDSSKLLYIINSNHIKAQLPLGLWKCLKLHWPISSHQQLFLSLRVTPWYLLEVISLRGSWICKIKLSRQLAKLSCWAWTDQSTMRNYWQLRVWLGRAKESTVRSPLGMKRNLVRLRD